MTAPDYSMVSLCSGYGGLDLAIEALLPVRTVAFAEFDDAPASIFARHWPGIPNLRDVNTIAWDELGPVDVLSAGYPCQPFSHAGKRQGEADARHLWPAIRDGIRVLRPRHVVCENVAGHLSLGFDRVLGDLAALGYCVRWTVLRAADVGAPHGRKRLFFVATDPEGQGQGHGGGLLARRLPTDVDAGARHSSPTAAADSGGERHGRGQDGRSVGRVDRQDAGAPRQRERARQEPGDRGAAATADTAHVGHERARRSRNRRPGSADSRVAPADADGAGLEGRRRAGVVGANERTAGAGSLAAVADAECGTWRASARQRPRSSEAEGTRQAGVTSGRGAIRNVDWGVYAPAVARWEAIIGRPAPAPTDDRGRLAPAFVEWMMGLPAGWVTDTPLTRAQQLKALGNGVVPQQAAAALTHLLATQAVAA